MPNKQDFNLINNIILAIILHSYTHYTSKLSEINEFEPKPSCKLIFTNNIPRIAVLIRLAIQQILHSNSR